MAFLPKATTCGIKVIFPVAELKLMTGLGTPLLQGILMLTTILTWLSGDQVKT